MQRLSQTGYAHLRAGGRSLALLLVGAAATFTMNVPASPAQPIRARTAHALTVKDEGNLRLVKSSGSTLIDEGPAHGTIPGKVRIRFVYDGDPTINSQITIYAHSGEILARASGRLSSPTSATPSFSGTLTITGGSGTYAHAHGSGHLYGVFYRRTYAITVQTQGALNY